MQTETINALAVVVGLAIVVVGDNVGVSELERIQFGALHEPYAYGERLAHLALARPTEDIAQQGHGGHFVSRVAWLIVQVPHPDTLIVLEGSHYVLDILLQDREKGRGVGTQTNSRVLHPT